VFTEVSGQSVGSIFNYQSFKNEFFFGCLTLEDGNDRVNETSVITYESCMTSQKAGMSKCKNLSVIIIRVFDGHVVIISPLSTLAHKHD
jgi:hypothetical protein